MKSAAGSIHAAATSSARVPGMGKLSGCARARSSELQDLLQGGRSLECKRPSALQSNKGVRALDGMRPGHTALGVGKPW